MNRTLLLESRVQVFMGNDRFDRSSLSIFREALRFFYRWLGGWRSKYLFAYKVALQNGVAYLVGSSVHERELRLRLPGEISWHQGFQFYSFTATCKAKINTLLEAPRIFEVLRKQRALNHIFHVLYNFYNYYVYIGYLERIDTELEPQGYGSFELHYTGEAVNEYCFRAGKSSRFVQHGLFDQSLCPIRFDEYYVWSEWDRKFFSSEVLNQKFFLKYPKIVEPLPLQAGTSRVLYFALEYPSPMLSLKFMLSQISELAIVAADLNWTLILRPHPRDTSNLAKLLASQNGANVNVDRYANLPVVESFRRNKAGIFATFNSASIFEIRNEGIFCITIRNPLQDYILVPYSKISVQLSSIEELRGLLTELDAQSAAYRLPLGIKAPLKPDYVAASPSRV